MTKPTKATAVKATEVKGGKKTKLYLGVLLIGVALTGWSLIDKNKSDWKIGLGDEDSDNLELEDEEVENDTEDVAVTVTNNLEGTLNVTDNTARGNLKLVSRMGDIYIRTARDFSALIGLQVMARINGTLDNFELVDIQPKIEKDGYIIPH